MSVGDTEYGKEAPACLLAGRCTAGIKNRRERSLLNEKQREKRK
jgi:hypothetical protein